MHHLPAFELGGSQILLNVVVLPDKECCALHLVLDDRPEKSTSTKVVQHVF